VRTGQVREFKCLVERAEFGRLGFEFLRVVRGPPIGQNAIAVALAALVVKAVRDLVPDHRPDASVVDCRVGAGSKNGG